MHDYVFIMFVVTNMVTSIDYNKVFIVNKDNDDQTLVYGNNEC